MSEFNAMWRWVTDEAWRERHCPYCMADIEPQEKACERCLEEYVKA